MELNFLPAGQNELQNIRELLTKNNLPIDDLSEPDIKFFGLYYEQKLIGTIGIEKYDNTGLLRSMAIIDELKNQGIGGALLGHFLDWCDGEGIAQLFLITTTAERFFSKHGFSKIERGLVPDEIQKTREFKDICPSSAIVMIRVIG